MGTPTETYLQTLFSSLLEGEYIELRFISETVPGAKSYFLTNIEDAEAIALANSGSLHVFCGAAPRSEQSGTKEAVKRVPVLWGEVDAKDVGGKENAYTCITDGFIFKPTLLVDSGHGYHAYWLLEKSCEPTRAEELMARIRACIHGDAVHDVSRVMRVPGTLNIKNGEELPCRIVSVSPTTYSRRDIEAALNADKEVRHVIMQQQEPKSANDKSRSGVDWWLIRRLLYWGMSQAGIHALYAQRPVGQKARERKGDYLTRTIKKATASLPIAPQPIDEALSPAEVLNAFTPNGYTIAPPPGSVLPQTLKNHEPGGSGGLEVPKGDPLSEAQMPHVPGDPSTLADAKKQADPLITETLLNASAPPPGFTQLSPEELDALEKQEKALAAEAEAATEEEAQELKELLGFEAPPPTDGLVLGDSIFDPASLLALDEEDEEDDYETAEDIARYFMERDDCYHVAKDGRVVSTFVYQPMRLLVGKTEDSFLGNIRSSGNLWTNISLTRSAFARTDPLLRQLRRVEWQWLGSDKEVRMLLPYLVRKWRECGAPTAEATSVQGRHGDYWVAEEGTFSEDALLDQYTAPIVYMPAGRARPIMKYVETEKDEDYHELLESIWYLLPRINKPEVVFPTLGWFMAAPLKPILNQLPSPVRFPHLNLFGTKGCGKTSTIQKVFQRLMGYTRVESFTCSTTPYVLLALASSTNAIPVSLSEFRKSSMSQRSYEGLKRILLLSYDYGRDSRGNANQTTTEYEMTAPLVLDGEDIIDDPAIRERTIYVTMSPEDIQEDTEAWECFGELILLPLEQFARRYIQYTLTLTVEQLEEDWKACYEAVVDEYQERLGDRVRRNLATVLLGIRTFENFLRQHDIEVEETSPRVLRPSLNENQQEENGRGRIGVDDFVEDVVNDAALSSAGHFILSYDPQKNILWFQLSSTLSWWQETRKRRNQSVMESPAVKSQLREMKLADGGEGRYVWGPQVRRVGGTTVYMYGIDLTMAKKTGLDIPDRLGDRKITFILDGGSV